MKSSNVPAPQAKVAGPRDAKKKKKFTSATFQPKAGGPRDAKKKSKRTRPPRKVSGAGDTKRKKKKGGLAG